VNWATMRRTKSFRYLGPKKADRGTLAEVKARDGVISGESFITMYSLLRSWGYQEVEVAVVPGKGKKRANPVEMEMLKIRHQRKRLMFLNRSVVRPLCHFASVRI
jgi:hypothetical protein